MSDSTNAPAREVFISVSPEGERIGAFLRVPDGAKGAVVFAHGSGSSRHSSRNQFVAGVLNEAGFGTLLLDLLTPAEERVDEVTREHRFDIPLLAGRVSGGIRWLSEQPETAGLALGTFGSSTGGAAAIIAGAEHPDKVRAVVSRGGRPDLAEGVLERNEAPTLLIVGERDEQVIGLNREAMGRMRGAGTRLELVPGATHLFEEPGTLEIVAGKAREWFEHFLS